MTKRMLFGIFTIAFVLALGMTSVVWGQQNKGNGDEQGKSTAQAGQSVGNGDTWGTSGGTAVGKWDLSDGGQAGSNAKSTVYGTANINANSFDITSGDKTNSSAKSVGNEGKVVAKGSGNQTTGGSLGDGNNGLSVGNTTTGSYQSKETGSNNKVQGRTKQTGETNGSVNSGPNSNSAEFTTAGSSNSNASAAAGCGCEQSTTKAIVGGNGAGSATSTFGAGPTLANASTDGGTSFGAQGNSQSGGKQSITSNTWGGSTPTGIKATSNMTSAASSSSKSTPH